MRFFVLCEVIANAHLCQGSSVAAKHLGFDPSQVDLGQPETKAH